MLDQKTVAAAAQALHDAGRTKKLIRALSVQHPGLTIDDGYAIQRAWTELEVAEGRRILGHKIGLTSRAMQNAVGIGEPDYGVLLDDMFFEDGAQIPAGRFIGPRVEIELAFRLRTPLRGPGCTIFDVLNATDYVVPVIEILESRMHLADPETKATRKVMDSIADNAAVGGVVIGGRPMRPDAVDLRWVAALCLRNGEVEESGVAAAVLGHPANGVAWLANRLAQRNVGLEAGELLLSGSFIRPVAARPGDTIHADYGPHGTVSCHFG
ncbi:MAG: 2-oxo-hept-4-ene-1,7-dioate hydratase [Lautropia sp.]